MKARPRPSGLLLAGLVAGLVLCAPACRPARDAGVCGAYKLDNGDILIIGPSTEKSTLRLYVTANGFSRRLYPVAGSDPLASTVRYQSGDGFSVKEPAATFVEFRKTASAEPTLRWEGPGREPIGGTRLPIRVEDLVFESRGSSLTGNLYLPAGKGPHPAIVLHQGSEHESWKDHCSSGYLFAAHGVAALCYDKRGVGKSEGTFTMDFHELAADMGAAVERLKRHEAIDAARVGVGGYSQGGWIGPLTASQREDVRFVLVGFGLADSPLDEDREQTLNVLRDLRYGEADLDKARRVIGAVHDVLRQGLKGGWRELRAVKKEYRDEPWMKHLDGGVSGAFVKWPAWALRLFARKQLLLHGLTWDYDPRPTLEKVTVPMLWLLGGDDREAPNHETLARLAAFREQGKPFDVVVLPAADHGGIVFRTEKGARVPTAFHPDYLRTEAGWVARIAGVVR